MAVKFHKLQCSGNDFLFVLEKENENLSLLKKQDFIEKICHRRFGVGADGIFFVFNNGNVIHFDPDGSESFCVNGSLCLAFFSEADNSIPQQFTLAGVSVKVESSNNPEIFFQLNLKEKRKITVEGIDGIFADIGNPHFFVENVRPDFYLAEKLRHSPAFGKGANISFFEKWDKGKVTIATFERGVEDFTLSCGSACAAFCAVFERQETEFFPPSGIPLKVKIVNNTVFVRGEVAYVAKGDFLC